MQFVRFYICALVACLLTGCYHRGQQTPDAWDLTKQQLDSISFSTTHHYTQNYNFVVTAPQLQLSDALPDYAFDTMYIDRGERIVVADICTLPTDSIDSVWVKVARDQAVQGWLRESELLAGVSPDDPISQFIDLFSDIHLLVFMAFCVLVGGAYAMHRLERRQAYLVHFRDINSPYPTALCLLVAISATLYASIQLFGAESWRHYYFHPSLNPFALPWHLGLFVASVWAAIITALAAVEDTFRQLKSTADAVLYLGGLLSVCAVNYVVFSIFTLYYVGYLLLAVYIVFAVIRYFSNRRSHYLCGRCGTPIQTEGRCPHCGAINTKDN
ncbi:MAG: zinc ribbon domain-containing protein [Prevotella sp.]|nr:zinc ribbon domain-containing protein [Prevotella sp.]